MAVWRDTRDYSDCIPPPPRSQKFRWAANEQWNRPPVGMKVSVQDIDCLTACKNLIDAGCNPAVLNLADILVPGGCVESGSGAQEESIFRRSNITRTLTEELYPIQCDEAVYSPGVTVFRAPEAQGHVFLSEPYKAAFIACPGVYRPQIDSSGRLATKHVQQLDQKLDLILKLAACFGHDSVVLGPMGCGAWKNPPAQVAEVFARVLQRDAWGLQQVVVACLSTGNQGMERSPYLTSNSNFHYFSKALIPDATVEADDNKQAKDCDQSNAIDSET
ncbi:hypothetical protein WJX77_009435 [Trebouxia sp. C0004]